MRENEQKKKRRRKWQKTSILLYAPTKTVKLPTYNYNKKPDYRDSGRSRPMENKRTGGGECRAGTGSPRKTFALARWMQHEIIPYQRHISADGSKPRAEARGLGVPGRSCSSGATDPIFSTQKIPRWGHPIVSTQRIPRGRAGGRCDTK